MSHKQVRRCPPAGAVPADCIPSEPRVINGQTIRVWYKPGHEALAEAALNTAEKAVRWYATYFGIPSTGKIPHIRPEGAA